MYNLWPRLAPTRKLGGRSSAAQMIRPLPSIGEATDSDGGASGGEWNSEEHLDQFPLPPQIPPRSPQRQQRFPATFAALGPRTVPEEAEEKMESAPPPPPPGLQYYHHHHHQTHHAKQDSSTSSSSFPPYTGSSSSNSNGFSSAFSSNSSSDESETGYHKEAGLAHGHSVVVVGGGGGGGGGGGSLPPPPLRKRFWERGWLGTRGGWGKILVVVLLCFVLLGIALGVGLGIGLRKKRSSNTSSPTTAPSPSSSPSFPAGSWTFTTALLSTSSNCTSNPLAWSCYPAGITYASSHTDSATTFNWIIDPVSASPDKYTISSSANPFAPSFNRTTTSLLDIDTPSERLTFSVDINIPIIPSSPLLPGGRGGVTTCWFNGTTLRATLWTRQPTEYNITSSSSSTTTTTTRSVSKRRAFQSWPYRVEITEEISSSSSSSSIVPDCIDSQGRKVGDFSAPSSSISSGAACSCRWANYDLG